MIRALSSLFVLAFVLPPSRPGDDPPAPAWAAGVAPATGSWASTSGPVPSAARGSGEPPSDSLHRRTSDALTELCSLAVTGMPPGSAELVPWHHAVLPGFRSPLRVGDDPSGFPGDAATTPRGTGGREAGSAGRPEDRRADRSSPPLEREPVSEAESKSALTEDAVRGPATVETAGDAASARSGRKPISGPSGAARERYDRGRWLLLAGRYGDAWELLRSAGDPGNVGDPGDVGDPKDLEDPGNRGGVGEAGEPGYPGGPSLEADAFARAWAAWKSGDREAGRLLRPFTLRSVPIACRVPARLAAARALAEVGDAGALDELEALATDVPEIADYLLLWRLEALARLGREAAADTAYRALLDLRAGPVLLREADGARARLYESSGERARARAILEGLVGRVPRAARPRLLIELASLDRRLDDPAGAERRAREVVLGYPESPEAEDLLAPGSSALPRLELSPSERARVLAAHGRSKEALAALSDAIDPAVLVLRAEIRLRSADYAGSAADYREALARGGDPAELGMDLAKAYERGGEPRRARDVYRGLLERPPGGVADANLPYLIADSFQDESAVRPQLTDSASVWFRLLVDRYPRSELAPRGLVRLAQIASARGDWSAAGDLYREVLSRYPRSEDARSALYWMGRAMQAMGREVEARAAFARLLRPEQGAVGGDPPGSDYYGLLARRRLGDGPDEAGAALVRGAAGPRYEPDGWSAADTVLPAGPGSRPLRRARALILVGELTAAQREIDEAVRLSGNSREALGRVARWALARGYPESSYRIGRTLLASGGGDPVARLAYPAAFSEYVGLEGLETGLPEGLLWAVMRQESSFDPAVRSPAGALGLLQLMPATARGEALRLGLPPFEAGDLVRAEANLHLGAAHLADLVDHLDGDRVAAIAAYNAGLAQARRWRRFPEAVDDETYVERIPFRETRNYVKRVIASEARYEELYAER